MYCVLIIRRVGTHPSTNCEDISSKTKTVFSNDSGRRRRSRRVCGKYRVRNENQEENYPKGVLTFSYKPSQNPCFEFMKTNGYPNGKTGFHITSLKRRVSNKNFRLKNSQNREETKKKQH